MPEMSSRINPVVFLRGLRAAGNRFITPRKLMEISRSVFGKDLTPEQARDHLVEVDSDLRPLYSATLWLLARGNVREGSVQEILPFCRRRQAYWKVTDPEDSKYARENYIRALVCRFPEKRFVDEGQENPWSEIKPYSVLFSLNPNTALSVIDLPESKEDLLALYAKGDLTVANILKIMTRFAGLTEIPANIIARMQRDFLFAFVLYNKTKCLGSTTYADRDFIEETAAEFHKLLSDPKMEYSFEEAQCGLGAPLNNFGLNILSMYKDFKTNGAAYEERLKEDLAEFTIFAEKDVGHRVYYSRLSQIYREICSHIDKIVQVYGLDFEVDHLPRAFFNQGYRGGMYGDWGEPGREDYYKHQLRNILFIAGILIKQYGYHIDELRG